MQELLVINAHGQPAIIGQGPSLTPSWLATPAPSSLRVDWAISAHQSMKGLTPVGVGPPSPGMASICALLGVDTSMGQGSSRQTLGGRLLRTSSVPILWCQTNPQSSVPFSTLFFVNKDAFPDAQNSIEICAILFTASGRYRLGASPLTQVQPRSGGNNS